MQGSLIDGLMKQLQGETAGKIAQQLGTDSATLEKALGAAVPMMMGAMQRNTQTEQGADALLNALKQDHSGSDALDITSMLGGLLGAGAASGSASNVSALGGLGDLLGSVLGGATGASNASANRQLNADGILGHIFGSSQSRAQSGLEQATGLSSGQSGMLLKILAPIVMSYLAKQVSGSNMNASALSQALGAERSQVQAQGGAGSALLSMLDTDGDGDFDVQDMMRLGSQFLK